MPHSRTQWESFFPPEKQVRWLSHFPDLGSKCYIHKCCIILYTQNQAHTLFQLLRNILEKHSVASREWLSWQMQTWTFNCVVLLFRIFKSRWLKSWQTLKRIRIFNFFFLSDAWKAKSNFLLERHSDIDLEFHFKRITSTHTSFSSIQRAATTYLFSFMGISFIAGQAGYKEMGSL